MDTRQIKLIVIIVLVFCGSHVDSYGQTDLVRWNTHTAAPTPEVPNITAHQIVLGGVSVDNAAWSGYRVKNFHYGTDNTINYGKYLEFRVTPNAGYKILPSQFNFRYYSPTGGGGPTKLQIRYSTDPTFPANGTLLGSEQNLILGSEQTTAINFPANFEVTGTLYLRVYMYGQTYYSDFYIRNPLYNSSIQGPTITGVVSPSVTGDPTDLKVTKSMNNDTPQPGDEVVYTITVNNLGSNAATSALVTDQLPPGFVYVDAEATAGTYDAVTGIWTIGNLAEGAMETLLITAEMQTTGPYTNTATVSHAGVDPVSANNSESVTPSNVCGGCTHIIPNGSGHIEVLAGQTWCLHSGTFTGTFNVQAGGTICIASGATFSPTSPAHPVDLNGFIINRGTMTFPLYSEHGPHTGTIVNHGVYNTPLIAGFAGMIENYGTIYNTGGTEFASGGSIVNSGYYTATTFQYFSGTLTNSGTFSITGDVSLLSGAEIINHDVLTFGTLSATNTEVYNYGELTVSAGVNVSSGYWNNHNGGTVLLQGGNINFTGGLDNSGYWEFERISILSSSLNNYGHMKVFNAAMHISSTTYLTNDGLLEFIGVPDVQYNGPMLINNGTLTLTHGITGNFKMNQAINQVFNNGLIVVSGQFEQNATGSLLVNSCRIVARHVFVGNGEARNSGLIWAVGTAEGNGVAVQGIGSILRNSETGHVRGTNFVNSGLITGYGAFYFTGETNMSTGGSFWGDAPNSILFYDASQTGDQIFDKIHPSSDFGNILRPANMTPMDSTSYNCTAAPVVAGYPPVTQPFSTVLCEPASVVVPLADLVSPNSEVPGPFTVLYGTLRLFEAGNADNPTNNSTSLVVSGKGTFTANTTTGEVVFEPLPAFTGGEVIVEYRISNNRPGDPIVYPSPRTKITIRFVDIDLPEIQIKSGVNPVCVSQTLTLSNELDGGGESSNPSVASVDENGVVKGLTAGTATISYTVTEQTCGETATFSVTVEVCSGSTTFLIANPMIRQRMKRGS